VTAAWNGIPQIAAGLVGQLVRASIAGGLLVLVIWLLCRWVPRLSPLARTWIWWLASLKFLLVLLAIPSLPIPILPAAEIPAGHEIAAGSVDLDTAARLAPVLGTRAVARPDRTTVERVSRWHEAAPVGLILLWITGLGLALLPIGRDVLAARTARADSRPVNDAALVALFERLRRELGVRSARLRAMPGDGSPRVMGLMRPVVLLPEAALRSLSQQELEWVLSHELLHLRRKDLWLGLIPALAERLFYFHPLARLASREYGSARESACDAAVLAGRNPSPRAYGRLLLKLGVRACPPSSVAALVDRKSLQRRLEMLHQITHRPGLRRTWPFIVVAVLALVPLRLVAAGTDAPQPADHRRGHPEVTRLAQSTPATAPTPAPPTEPSPPARANQPAAAPTPPTPPGAPVETETAVDMETETETETDSAESGLAFVFLREGDTLHNSVWIDGSTSDVDRARTLRHGSESLLYGRTNEGAWVIRDPQTLQRVDAIFGPQRELGRQQAELGRQQAEIGRQQAEVGKSQAELGKQQAELGRQQAELGAQQAELAARQVSLQARLARMRLDRADGSQQNDDEATAAREAALRQRLREVSEQQRRLADQQRALGEQQGALGSHQGKLGRKQRPLAEKQRPLAAKQRELAARQRAAALQARRELHQIVEQAIADGRAEPVK
jgi:bla regulator protein BlaR1